MKKFNTENLLVWLGYLLVIIFFMGPILYVISMSLKTPEEVFSTSSLIPRNPTLNNFVQIWNNTSMGGYIFNSLRLVFFTVIGALFVATMAGYAFSRFRFRNRNLVMFGILMFQMISPVVIGIPLYRYYANLDLLNNYFGLIMAYIAIQVPFATFLMQGVFEGIPKELDEAALIDGASRFQLLAKVIIPAALPGMASAVIFISINSWSQFILPFFLLNQNKLYPVSVGVLMAQGTFQDISIQLVAAASVIGLLPAILMVLFMQKFILKALVSGAVKG